MVQTNTLISDALVPPPPSFPAGQQQQASHLITAGRGSSQCNTGSDKQLRKGMDGYIHIYTVPANLPFLRRQ